MAEIPEKPPKKVKVHSLGSFWWQVIKKSFKHAWEPFETIGTLCAIFAGMVAAAYLTHQVTQEWGDYMIYWSIAVPVGVWWILFLWNLIKFPHKIYKEDLAAASSGATPVSCKEIANRNFGRFLFVVIIVSAFVCLLSVKNLKISQLESQLTQPRQVIPKKPLRDKIIPQPAPSNAPSIVSPPRVTNAEPPIQFVTSNPSIDSDDPESELVKLRAKKLVETAAKKETERKQIQSDADERWKQMLPTYKDCIETFYNVLKKRSRPAQ